MAQRKIEVIRELYTAAHVESTTRLADLEEAVAEYKEYQQELAAAVQWMAKTRQSIQVQGNSLSLLDSLNAQEVQGLSCLGM